MKFILFLIITVDRTGDGQNTIVSSLAMTEEECEQAEIEVMLIAFLFGVRLYYLG